MAGYYQGLLKAQGELADIEQKRESLGLLGARRRGVESELAEFESTAPLRIGMREAQLKSEQALAPQRSAQLQGQGIENRAGMLKMIQAGKALFPQVGDQMGLDQANSQFEQFTGQASPYRGKQFTPDFRSRVMNDLMTIEQRVQLAGQTGGKAPPGYRPTAQGNLEAIPGGPADVKMSADEAKRRDETGRTLNAYVAARDGLLTGLGESSTGPIVGRFPALTSEQQVASGAVSAMAPVLKQLFRVAGEGTFTDRDQALLLDMVPDRTDSPSARAAKMANIDRIVGAKLGTRIPPPGRGPAQARGGGIPQTSQGGGLSPEEQQELNALRRQFGR